MHVYFWDPPFKPLQMPCFIRSCQAQYTHTPLPPPPPHHYHHHDDHHHHYHHTPQVLTQQTNRMGNESPFGMDSRLLTLCIPQTLCSGFASLRAQCTAQPALYPRKPLMFVFTRKSIKPLQPQKSRKETRMEK